MKFFRPQQSPKLLSVFLLVLLSSAMALYASYWIAEHYFFDKFFYQKSVARGYWAFPDGDYQELANFGARGAEMLALDDYIHDQKDPTILNTKAKNVFTIALFGDSFTWGEGVYENERFAHIIEEELNKHQPTRVMVFATGGDNISDQWKKYNAFLSTGKKADLYLFGVVHNDAFIKSSSMYGNYGQDLIDSCGGVISQDPSDDPTNHDMDHVYPVRVKESMNPKTKNFCIAQAVVQHMPKEHAMYIGFDSLLTENPDYLAMAELYRKAKLPILTFHMIAPEKSPEQESLFVSKMDHHPSKIAHQIYAKAIVRTLLQDKRFGFIER